MACDACRTIGETISSNRYFDEIDLCTYGEMLSKTDCMTCQQILDASGRPQLEPQTLVHLRRYREPASEYQIVEEDYTDFVVDILPLKASNPLQSTGVPVDKDWIDVGRIKRWLQRCNETHGGHCHHLPEWQEVKPKDQILLLDVQRGCLVATSGAEKYFALSYV